MYQIKNGHPLVLLNQGRLGTNAVIVNNKVYIAAGCANRGGESELNSIEVLDLTIVE
ncbi:MAG: kelch motif-containing protein [Reichenbachiella sp.]